MKIFARISLMRNESNLGLVLWLRTLFPQQIPRGFRCRAPLDDPKTQEVLARLNDAGLTPWDFNRGQPLKDGSEYMLEFEREYAKCDYEICEYLEIWPTGKAVHIEASSRTDSGQIILPQRKMPRGFAIMITHLHRAFFVTERAKLVLEANGMRHVNFRPASYRPSVGKSDEAEGAVIDRHDQPYWEIDSDFTMPSLSPSMRFTDEDGGPWVRDDFSNGLQAREGFFTRPELHYRESDIANIGPFDLARTFEPFGNYRHYDRLNCRLIASRRFYETCVANKLKTEWVPVRVDPD